MATLADIKIPRSKTSFKGVDDTRTNFSARSESRIENAWVSHSYLSNRMSRCEPRYLCHFIAGIIFASSSVGYGQLVTSNFKVFNFRFDSST